MFKKPVLFPVRVFLTCGDRQEETTLYARYWTTRDAKIRGFNFFSIIYFFGSSSFFNPVLIIHLLVPPIWVLIGPWVGYKIFKLFENTIEIKKGLGTCPACRKTIMICPYGELEAFKATCPSCSSEIKGAAVDARKTREHLINLNTKGREDLATAKSP